MIGWSDINPVLLDVFREVAVDLTRPATKFKAEWRDRPASFTDPDQKLTLRLRVTSVSAIGNDDTRYTVDPDDATKQIATQTGQRKFTLQAQAIVPEQTDEQWCLMALERARTRLGSPRFVDRLLELDVDVIDCGPSMNVPFKDSGRSFSSGTMDVFFGCTGNEDDPIPAGWIQYLVISSHLKDGTELQSSLQLVNAEVPDIP